MVNNTFWLLKTENTWFFFYVKKCRILAHDKKFWRAQKYFPIVYFFKIILLLHVLRFGSEVEFKKIVVIIFNNSVKIISLADPWRLLGYENF